MQYPKTPNATPLTSGRDSRKSKNARRVAGHHVRRHRRSSSSAGCARSGSANTVAMSNGSQSPCAVIHVGHQHRVAVAGQLLRPSRCMAVADAAGVDVHDDARPRAVAVRGVQGDGAGAVGVVTVAEITRHGFRSTPPVCDVSWAACRSPRRTRICCALVLDTGTPEIRPHRHRHPQPVRPPAALRPGGRLPADHHQEGAPKSVVYELLWFLRGDSQRALAAGARRHHLGRMGQRRQVISARSTACSGGRGRRRRASTSTRSARRWSC